ncbi:MAG: ATP-binding cassette domain-containing protein [Bryobacteraceae bacterium]|nr:ATP-binding cassette domain-containing protein [Bryobacteraceae bacterium]
MLEAKIRKRLNSFTLDVEFRAAAGVTVLFGASGAGKTMTLDSIAGFVHPDEGRILLDGAILFDAGAKVDLAPQERNCGYVFQNYALFPHMTLRENLLFAVEKLARLERHCRVNEAIEKFKLGEAASRKPGRLSGGERQRASIARALLASPKLLLLDEPSRGLDAPLRADLYEALRQVRRDFSTPILLVTHDLDECFALGGEMLILREGRIVQTGAPASVVAKPATLEVARLLGLYNLLPAEIVTLDPQNDASVLRVLDREIAGRYYPGRLKGDRVWVSIPYSAVRARPLNGKPAANEIAVTLESSGPTSAGVRLEFEGGVIAESAPQEGGREWAPREWAIEFPAAALHVLSK